MTKLDHWPQRARLKELVAAYRLQHNKIELDEVASRLGVSVSHLKCLMYDKRIRPGGELFSRMSSLFRVSVTEFMDDPGGEPIPGVAHVDWNNAGERDRLIARAMFADLTSDQLSEAEKDEIYRAYKEAKERMLRMRKHLTSTGGDSHREPPIGRSASNPPHSVGSKSRLRSK